MKKKVYSVFYLLIVAVILLIFMYQFNHVDGYGNVAMEAAARWAVCFLVLIADVSVGVIHAIILLIIHIIKRRKKRKNKILLFNDRFY